jgi:hypothetical protein
MNIVAWYLNKVDIAKSLWHSLAKYTINVLESLGMRRKIEVKKVRQAGG